MRQHLRRSLVYQNALRTGSIMTETPANSILALRSRRYEHMHDDLWIYSAGKKLDHLIREALDPMIRCIRPYEPPAIMVFLNEFDRTFLKMRITDEAREWIESRIAFCREMIGVAKQECEAYAWLPHHLIRNYMRDRSVVRTTHPDWEFLSTSRMTGADAWMQNLGRGSGEIKTLDNLSKMPNRDATGSSRSFGPTPSSGSSG